MEPSTYHFDVINFPVDRGISYVIFSTLFGFLGRERLVSIVSDVVASIVYGGLRYVMDAT